MAKTLLIVEDDAIQRDLLCTLLEAHGYACIGVEDGQRALERRLGVVVVSGFGPVSRFAERLPLVRAVVQKPVDLDALLEAVQRCVGEGATPTAEH